MKHITVKILLIVCLLIPSVILCNKDTDVVLEKKVSFFQPIIDSLNLYKADTNFIRSILTRNFIAFDEKYCQINVLGTAKKANYTSQYNAEAVEKTKEFLTDCDVQLAEAEALYGVPKEIIAALLYVETRHGNYLGNHRIINVYLSLAMVNQPEYISKNFDNLVEHFSGTPEELKEYQDKLTKRTETKAAWAVQQLVAMSKIYKKGVDVFEIRGSWAGAFGISQFIPDSYNRWAVDGNGDGVIDLFDVNDAIFSVANYLKTNGWGNSPEKQKAALFHYNHSNDYVNAILTLAEKSKL
ncbi:MAG: lytic murein transglycosylase [bacterium]